MASKTRFLGHIFICVLAFSTAIIPSFAQADESSNQVQLSTRDERPNTFMGEILGRSRKMNVSYERAISSKFSVGAGLGIIEQYTTTYINGFATSSSYSGNTEVLLFYANYYFSEKPSSFFVTAGTDINFAYSPLWHLGGGYDWQISNALKLRGALYIVSEKFYPGIGLGFTF
jgi:hypothetical protein